MDKLDTILVVDDEATQRAILFDYLDKNGYRVLLAENGEAAVEITKLTRPDIILLDIMLPGIDGYETCRRIKEQNGRKDIPILFMSSLDDGATRSAIFKAGGNAHLLKPPVPDEVTALIEQNLRSQRCMRQLEALKGRCSTDDTQINHFVDYVAHDMKNPLLGIMGFAEELVEELQETNGSEDLIEFASLIQQSSIAANDMLDALILLKNLLLHEETKLSHASLEEIFQSASARHTERTGMLPFSCELSLEIKAIKTDPILFEELIVTIFRIISQLNSTEEILKLQIECSSFDPYTAVLNIDAPTRTMSPEEVPLILEPITAQGRKKIKGTDISTVCAQQLIQVLNLSVAVKATDRGLSIALYLRTVESA